MMPKRTKIEPHLTIEELAYLIKRSKESVSRQQLRVIHLMMRGKTQKEVAQKIGYSAAWVHTIIHRYNKYGPKILRDHRKDNTGRPYKLSMQIREEMRELVSRPPQEAEVWTRPMLVKWVRERTGDQQINNKRGWEWLCQLNCTNRLKRRGVGVQKHGEFNHVI